MKWTAFPFHQLQLLLAADLILQDDTADNEMMYHAGRDDKMDRTFD